MTDVTNNDVQVEKEKTSQSWAESTSKWLPGLLSLLGAAAGSSISIYAAIAFAVVLGVGALLVPKLLKDKAFNNAKEEAAATIGSDVIHQANEAKENAAAVDAFLGRK